MNFTFLFCSERSGSNLITRIMDSHSEICGPAPMHLFRILLNHRNRYGDLEQTGNQKALVEDILALQATSLGVWRSSWSEDELLGIAGTGSLARILRAVYEREAQVQGKSRLFIKENHNYRFIHFLDRAFPGARYLFFVRDPRDMALSWKRSPNLRGCVVRAARTWRTDQQNVLRLLGTMEDRRIIHLLRYEDLLQHPDPELRKVCEFLGTSFEEGMLRFAAKGQSTRNAERSADWQNLKKPIMQNNFRKYHEGLTGREIEYVEAVCHEEMLELGYALEMEKTGEPHEIEHEIQSLERWDKPEYQKIPEDERRVREERFKVVQGIKGRPIQALGA